MRIGSLCSGYAGLDMAVESVTGATTAWFCEYDRDPSKILAHHWPDVPNHGDVWHTDWSQVEPVDILTAGYPCQPFSHAGKRKGADDPRHLWPGVARAIGALRPRLVVLENVRGHVSLGLPDVLGDLSELGYDATWGVVQASDAGAPHERARIFILATPDAGGGSLPRPATAGDGLSVAAERGDLAPADARRERHGRGQDGRVVGRVDGAHEGATLQRERPRGLAVDRGSAAWGRYAEAVARWEAVTGRRAPRPTEHDDNGPRLSPAFVEWMMGLPAGHVTNVPDLSRNAQLKALGNGVVPQQAALALRMLLPQAVAA